MTINYTTFLDVEISIGLFQYNHGFITNVALEDIDINVQFLAETQYHNSFVGGIVGATDYGVITKSYVVGSIEVKSIEKEVMIGGISGAMFGKIILSEIYSKGEISIDASDRFIVGGLVGALGWSDNCATITNGYSEMNIKITTADDIGFIGGLVGQIHRGPVLIQNVYYNGNIEINGSEYLFGLIGYDDPWNSLVLRNSYNMGYYIMDNWDYQYFDKIGNCYLIGEETSQTGFGSSTDPNVIDVTIYTSMTEFNPETNLGWDSAIWDFTTEHPTLKNLDNTPTYTTD